MSTTPATCQNCDAPLAPDAPGLVCPACLVGEVLGSVDTLDTEVDTGLPANGDRHKLLDSDSLEGSNLGQGGRYKILQRIGEGGFGTVYMAEQSIPVRRRVAVKILKAGMDTRQLLARFEAERQALAMMDYPNIAKVHDGGETEQGCPFFVMELVRGTPITAFCNREKLLPKARLKLFVQVCSAVQHAHQKGIIHRDLKPSNILITMSDGAEPVPKVIDFGVAKAMENNLTDKTLFTRFEQMIGTPAYMSPEQAGVEGTYDIDTRAEIYALGVLLYELLAGTTPFEPKKLQSAAFDEVRRILREDDVPRPSARLSSMVLDRRTTIARDRGTEVTALDKHLRGDLDWIVMKAIEKDRRRRYDTANALALDVERHLANEPVEARPPSMGYRFSKFTRRHKAHLEVAAMLVIVLIAGIAATVWQAVRAYDEKLRALEAEAVAEQRADEAEAISEFLVSMFDSSAPGRADGGPNITVVNSLKNAETQLENNTEMPPERRVILQQAIDDVYASLGRETESLALREKVLQYYTENREPEDPDRLSAMIKLAASQSNLWGVFEALSMAEEALEGLRRVRGPEHQETIAAMSVLANIYSRLKTQQEKATILHEELLKIYQKTLGSEHPRTLEMMLQASQSLERLERLLRQCRTRLGEEHPTTIRAMLKLARRNLSDSNKGKENGKAAALALGEEAMPLAVKVFGPKHRTALVAAGELAMSYHANKRTEEAVDLAEQNLSHWRKLWGPEHMDTLSATINLGHYYMKSGRADEAKALGEETLMTASYSLGLPSLPPGHPKLWQIARLLEQAYILDGEASKLVEMGFGLPLNQRSPKVVDVLVLPTSEWRWLHPVNGIDPAEADPDFHDTFFLPEFDDSTWAVGMDSSDLRGGFAYGDEDFTGVDIGIPTEKALGKSAYFRHRFTTEKEFTHLELRYHCDDGSIIYLDDVEIGRENMVEGREAYALPALWTVGEENETGLFRVSLEGVTLPAGEHVLAISLHNTHSPSSDLNIGAMTLVAVEPVTDQERKRKIRESVWYEPWSPKKAWLQFFDQPAANANEAFRSSSLAP